MFQSVVRPCLKQHDTKPATGAPCNVTKILGMSHIERDQALSANRPPPSSSRNVGVLEGNRMYAGVTQTFVSIGSNQKRQSVLRETWVRAQNRDRFLRENLIS